MRYDASGQDTDPRVCFVSCILSSRGRPQQADAEAGGNLPLPLSSPPHRSTSTGGSGRSFGRCGPAEDARGALPHPSPRGGLPSSSGCPLCAVGEGAVQRRGGSLWPVSSRFSTKPSPVFLSLCQVLQSGREETPGSGSTRGGTQPALCQARFSPAPLSIAPGCAGRSPGQRFAGEAPFAPPSLPGLALCPAYLPKERTLASGSDSVRAKSTSPPPSYSLPLGKDHSVLGPLFRK